MVEHGSQKNSVREVVFAAITTGKARMRPKWHFMLRALLYAVGLIIVLLALLYLTSFIVFTLHHTGAWFLPGFGLFGIGILLGALPWFLVFLGLIFVVVLELLVRHYSFAYRKPLLYSLIAIVLVVAATSALVARSGFHEDFFRRAREGSLPVAGGFYRGYGAARSDTVHPGIIIEITDDGFLMENNADERLTVVIVPETRFPFGTDFEREDRVLVLGERDGDSITAAGIRRIDDEVMRELQEHRRLRRGWFRPPMPANTRIQTSTSSPQ